MRECDVKVAAAAHADPKDPTQPNVAGGDIDRVLDVYCDVCLVTKAILLLVWGCGWSPSGFRTQLYVLRIRNTYTHAHI